MYEMVDIGCSHWADGLMPRQVQALEQAYDYWEKFQFDIIAAKVRGSPSPLGRGS